MKTKQSKWHKVDALKFDVVGSNGEILLPAGTKNVSIAFRCGCFTYLNQDGERVRANKYRDESGRIYYGR